MKARSKILCRDKYGNKLILEANVPNSTTRYDFQTDGRVAMTPALARRLSKELFKLLESGELKGEKGAGGA